jgi:hypothetical protein
MDGSYTRYMEQDVLSTRMVLQELGHIVHLKTHEIRGKKRRERGPDHQTNQETKPDLLKLTHENKVFCPVSVSLRP